jgi:hypothetical protein
MRMHMRRFTRLTNGFSKKLESQIAALALQFIYCNFIKIHGTLRCTPARTANVTDRLWEMSDVVTQIEEREAALKLEAKKHQNQSYARFGGALGHNL